MSKFLPKLKGLIYINGKCKGRTARKNRIIRSVQFVLWPAGEQGHKKDYWHNFDRSWWKFFVPDESKEWRK